MKREKTEREFGFYKRAFDIFYLCLVLLSIGGFIFAIYTAIVKSARNGIALGVAVIVLYIIATSVFMKHILGVGYMPIGAEISVSVKAGGVSAKNRKKYIPRRMLGFDTAVISGGAKCCDKKTEELYIFKGIKRIDADAFVGMKSLKKISFEGTSLEWSEIDCKADLSGIETVFLGDIADVQEAEATDAEQ